MDELIRQTAQQMADGYAKAEIPMYGASLRLPERTAVLEILKDFQKLLFPAYFGDKHLVKLPPEQYSALVLHHVMEKLERQIALALPEAEEARAAEICRELVEKLPKIQDLLMKDLSVTFEGDPAATSKEEIIFCYPGYYAIFVYRIAHELYVAKVPTIPRMMSEYAHSHTGIDINPGATIGRYFCMDHGTGIVVGETSIIGEHVKVYQGVTIGALSTRGGQRLRGNKRHPTIEDYVTIYAGASVLGGDTIIGRGSVIGANVFITSSVAPETRVGIKTQELIVKRHGETVELVPTEESKEKNNVWYYTI